MDAPAWCYRCPARLVTKDQQSKQYLARTPYLHRTIVESPKKPPSKATKFPDAQGAIEGTLEAWLPGLIESNQILTVALLRLRDLYLPQEPPASADRVLAEIEAALEMAARVQKGL